MVNPLVFTIKYTVHLCYHYTNGACLWHLVHHNTSTITILFQLKHPIRTNTMPNKSVDELIKGLEDLKLCESQVLNELVVARTEERSKQTTRTVRAKGEFRIGDRVEVTNEARTTFGRSASQKDREGRVANITAKRISIRTENNTNTEIAPHNLRLKDEL